MRIALWTGIGLVLFVALYFTDALLTFLALQPGVVWEMNPVWADAFAHGAFHGLVLWKALAALVFIAVVLYPWVCTYRRAHADRKVVLRAVWVGCLLAFALDAWNAAWLILSLHGL